MPLKLEVGKKYINRQGEIVEIVRYRCETSWNFIDTEGRSYTKIGGHSVIVAKAVPEDLFEEIIEEKTMDLKKGVLITEGRAKGCSFSDSFKGRVAEVVHDYVDEASVRITPTGFTQTIHAVDYKPCYYKEVTVVKSPASGLIKQLEDEGYVIDKSYTSPTYRKSGICFDLRMLAFSGEEADPDSAFGWAPEWLETRFEFVSFIEPERDYRQFIIDLMIFKQSLTHPAYLYQRDIDEIKEEWSDKDCEKIGKFIVEYAASVLLGVGFSDKSCAFCLKHGVADGEDKDCPKCSYGARHGICTRTASDFQRYVVPQTNFEKAAKVKNFIDNYFKGESK